MKGSGPAAWIWPEDLMLTKGLSATFPVLISLHLWLSRYQKLQQYTQKAKRLIQRCKNLEGNRRMEGKRLSAVIQNHRQLQVL